MRRLRGLHVEDCYLTFRIVQRVLRPNAHILRAATKAEYLDLIGKTSNDFFILDGDLPGWPISQYAKEISLEKSVPLFIYSSSSPKILGPLVDLKPKAVLLKSDGPIILSQAILSYFYAEKEFNFRSHMPKPIILS